jgi:hypothetical protein
MSGDKNEALHRQMLKEDKEMIEKVTRITDEPLGRPAPKLSSHYDEKDDVLVINGIRYSSDVFRQFGGMLPVGAEFKLMNREDGVLTIQNLSQQPAPKHNGLESRHKIGDDVKVEGKVTAVYFHEDKVKYVIKVSEHICIEMDSCDVHPKDGA